jgi:hypothetical protein
MRRWLTIPALAVLFCGALLCSAPASAQTSRDDDDRFEDEDDQDIDRFALAIGAGFVEPTGDVENYLMASLRIRVSGRDGGDRNRNGRGGNRGGEEGISGYIEPEVGYWEASGKAGEVSGSDLLLGANLVGVVPFGNVDTFFGVGAGVHFIDTSLLENDPFADDSETKLGGNAHFGLDLYITDNFSAFGAGRFDLVQGSEDSVQSKVYLGLRGRF